MRILVIRFSALGDVTLCLPVLREFKAQFPQHELFFLSRPALKDLFRDGPAQFIAADLQKEYKGLKGIHQLYSRLIREIKPDLVIDLHNVLRSKILSAFFIIYGTRVFKLNKDRSARKKLTRLKDKVRVALPHISEQYAAVFREAGFEFKWKVPQAGRAIAPREITAGAARIGFAPFAKHRGKTWPWEQSLALIEKLLKENYQLYLFGGKENYGLFHELAQQYPQVENCSGRYSIGEELALMEQLDAVISMDSFNMQLAALSSTPVVSIWGATHHYAGFGPTGSNAELMVEVPTEMLGCRPCSIFGNKDCYRKDYACLSQITPEMVMNKLHKALYAQ